MSDADRRTFLEWIVWVGAGVFGAMVSVPFVGALASPLVDGRRPRTRRGFVRVARLDALPIGEPRKVQVASESTDAWIRSARRPVGAVWLVRRQADRVEAWSATCPHLGCAIEQARGGFACPCHRSRFDDHGRRVDGPSPRGMDRLEVRVARGDVLVRWVTYRRGTARRVEV